MKQEFTAIIGLRLQHLFAEIVGDQPVVPAELDDELVCIVVEPERHSRQLQTGGPSFRTGDQSGHAVGSEGPTGDVLEQQGGVDLVEGQIGLADLQHPFVQPMSAPGNREIGTAGQHQMDIGRKEVDQATQIGDEHGIRKVVQVLENDDHLGQLGHLGFESFEQWRAEPPAVQRGQDGEIGKVRADGAQPPEEALGETDGVIVVLDDVQPDEIQLGMAGGPLRQEY